MTSHSNPNIKPAATCKEKDALAAFREARFELVDIADTLKLLTERDEDLTEMSPCRELGGTGVLKQIHAGIIRLNEAMPYDVVLKWALEDGNE